MAGFNKVQIEYDEMGNIANQFAQEAAGIEQLKGRIMSLVGELEGGGWIGRGAQAFYSEMFDMVEPALNRLVQALEEAAHVTKQVSQVLQNAEQEASGFFGKV